MDNFEINAKIEDEKKNQIKAENKDIVAICIAVYQILGPILIIFFAVFSLLVFLILNIWIK